MHWYPYRPMHAELREGDAVIVPSRRHWGRGVITDACDPAMLVVDFPDLGRSLRIGRAAVEPAGTSIK